MIARRNVLVAIVGFGAVSSVAAFVGANLFGWEPVPIGLLVVGGIALVVAAIVAWPLLATRPGRAFANTIGSVALIAVAFALFSYINWIAVVWAVDLTRDARYSLRRKSRAVVAAEGPQIELSVIASPDEGDRGGAALSDDLLALARQYRDVAPSRVTVRVFDAARDEMAAVRLLREAGLDPAAQIRPLVLVRAGSRQKVIHRPQLVRAGRDGTVEFLGEALVTNAIFELSSARRPTIYFTRGHGEGDESLHAAEGFTRLRAAVERDHVELRTVQLERVGEVPDDADALVILRPQREFTRRESDAIDRFLIGGGRLLVAVDSPFEVAQAPRELARLAARWGIAIDEVVACDPDQNKDGDPVKVWVERYGGHPTVGGLQGLPTIFLAPRGLRALDDTRSPNDREVETSILLQASARSFGETDVGRMRREGSVGFDRATDRRGPIAFGVLAREADGERAGARVVVLGDATFLDNVTLERFAYLRATHLALARNVVSWLLERDELIDVPARVRGDRRLTTVDISDRTIRAFTWGGMFAMPVVFLLAGLALYAFRRGRR